MTMWGGRFKDRMDRTAWKLNASLDVDRRMSRQDVRGSQAWARALFSARVITQSEYEHISTGLEAVLGELESGEFVYAEDDEDIHTAVERRLIELIGEPGEKLHTGRSRNDQVATDLRLWLLENLPLLEEALKDLQAVLIWRAEEDFGVIMPGYTHLQRAQPILLSHWWLAHFWPLQRDRQRLREAAKKTAVLPLGSAALAGTPFRIDRRQLAAELGFDHPCENSLDGVADRDYVAEFLFCTSLIGVHLSRLAESVILFSSAEFGFFELSEAFSSGSSLMPHKKNPDLFELARGKTGGLIGNLAGLLTTLKGLPSAYDKDLQEVKLPVFESFDSLILILPALAGALRTLGVNQKTLQAAIDAESFTTDLADYLVEKGVSFRLAHRLVGQLVQRAIEQGKSLQELELSEYQAVHPAFQADLYQVFDPQRSLSRRQALGGTAPEAVREQLQQARQAMNT
jgi:argininosuccinate lyase